MLAVAFSSAVDSGAPFQDSHGQEEAPLNEVEYYCSACLVLVPPLLVLLLVLSIGGVLGGVRRDDKSDTIMFAGFLFYCIWISLLLLLSLFLRVLLHAKYQHLLVLCRIVKRLAYEHQVIDGICQRLNGYTSHQ